MLQGILLGGVVVLGGLNLVLYLVELGGARWRLRELLLELLLLRIKLLLQGLPGRRNTAGTHVKIFRRRGTRWHANMLNVARYLLLGLVVLVVGVDLRRRRGWSRSIC